MNLHNFFFGTIAILCFTTISYALRLKLNYEDEENRINVLNERLLSLDDYIATNGLSSPEECKRPCKIGLLKTCYYRFYVEQYTVLGRACEICTPNRTNDCQCIIADGVERMSFTINRKIPGPAIEVCEKDRVIVDVINLTPSSGVTIHWHGMLQQDTQFYDGVPYVTQCPILPGDTFRYRWNADNPGSHFYHSHTGLQKIDGVAGPIIVRQPKTKNPSSFMYDFDLSEHMIFVQDWLHEYMDERYPGRIHSRISQLPENILINGKGPFRDSSTGTYTTVPYEVFTVSPNYRYRFRLINALASICPVQISIQDHELTVIATDGNPVEPVKVDAIISASAERFDFIVFTNKTEGTFWVHVKALEACKHFKLDQVAVLRYTDALENPSTPRPTYDNTFPIRKVLNPLDTNCRYTRDDAICLNQLRYDGTTDNDILKHNVQKIYLPFRLALLQPQDLYKPNVYERHFVVAGYLVVGLIDGIAYKAPPSPLLSQYRDIDPSSICNGDQELQNCGPVCRCTHIVKVDYGEVVELILVDQVHEDGINHPFHLHGHTFHVMAIGKLPDSGNGTLEEAIYLDSRNYFRRKFDNPPLKDTIIIPSNGYVVLRFKANNPGFWLLHCHFLLHLMNGMQAVLQVGNIRDMPKRPYGFPRCGNYIPDIYN